jgi:outer membrane protein OmpA-like peptidoglycan-associated protein
VADPVLSPAPGAFTGAQTVALASETPGAVIHYTTDGSTPTAASPVYTAPVPVSSDTTLRAVAVAPGAPDSAVTGGRYTITPPPPPPRVVVTKERPQLSEKVFFETGKHDIKSESFSLLDEVAAALTSHPEVKLVQIAGHTDNQGKAAFNRRLSKGRADAVRAYLVKQGIARERLDAEGYGESRPIADNATAKGREENRRVEFNIR